MSEAGKASPVGIVSVAVLGISLALVAVKFFSDRGRESSQRDAAAAASVRGSKAAQAADERALEASRAKYRRELRFCEGLRSFGGAEGACLGDFAAEHRDTFFCAEIPADAREGCFQRVARASGDSRLCDAIRQPELQRNCYLDAAAESGAASPCARIADAQVRRACVAVAGSDAGGCDAVSETAARNACFRRVAMRRRDPSICDSVRNKQMPDGFQHELWDCWKDAAVATGRREDCDRIPHEGVHVNTSGWHAFRKCRERIELRLAGADCREGPVDLTCRGKTAAAKNDFSMCEKGRSYTDMDLCAFTFAFRRNQASACASIRDERLRTACAEVAVAAAAAAGP